MQKTLLTGLMIGALALPAPAMAAEAMREPISMAILDQGLAQSLEAAPAPAEEDAEPTEAELDAREAQAHQRRGQLKLHQTLGLTTLAAMTATGLLGYASANGWLPLADPALVHVVAGTITSGLYLTTAGLSLTAPPPVFARKPSASGKGWDSVDVHRNLAWLHGAGMAATVGLGVANFLVVPGAYTDVHGWVALATYGLMATSAGVIILGN